MSKKLLLVLILTIFIIGMVCAFAVSPIDAKKYKNKNSITLKVKDGKKTFKIKCKYKKSYHQYIGHKKKNGEKYYAYIYYSPNNAGQCGKKGWWSAVEDEFLYKCRGKYNKNYPVTNLKLKRM